jgi:hypothetical protein
MTLNLQEKNEIRAKVAKLSSYSKLQWRKFDHNLDGYLTKNQDVLNFIKMSFDEAALTPDFDHFETNYNIEQIIDLVAEHSEGKITLGSV